MYLVTGGAGFIGSNLVAALAARGEEVLVVDRLREGVPGREKWRNLAKHAIAGLLPPEAIGQALATPGLKAVLHMGAISATTATDGDLVAATNLSLPLLLWEHCATRGIPLIYASSAATYGDGAMGFAEDAPLAALRPLNLYGWSKLAFDRRVQDLLRRGRRAPPQWAGLRFFNVYGPNEYHKGRMASVVFHKFHEVQGCGAAKLFRSDRPGIADGDQKRDFVHVDDCVKVMLWLLDNPDVSGLFNIGSGRARSFLDLVRAMFAAMGQNDRIEFVDMPADLRGKYQYFTEAPLGRLRAAGYAAPTIGLEEGVGRYVRDFLMREDPHR